MMRPTCYNQQGISTAPLFVAFAKAQGGLTAETRRVGSQIHVKSILRHCIDAKNITDWHATCCSKMSSIHRSTGLLDVDFQDVSVLDAKPLSKMSRHMGKGWNLGVLSKEDGSTKRWACPKKIWRLQNDINKMIIVLGPRDLGSDKSINLLLKCGWQGV